MRLFYSWTKRSLVSKSSTLHTRALHFVPMGAHLVNIRHPCRPNGRPWAQNVGHYFIPTSKMSEGATSLWKCSLARKYMTELVTSTDVFNMAMYKHSLSFYIAKSTLLIIVRVEWEKGKMNVTYNIVVASCCSCCCLRVGLKLQWVPNMWNSNAQNEYNTC